MWNLSLPWWEFVLRGAIVYVFLLLILRVTSKLGAVSGRGCSPRAHVRDLQDVGASLRQ